MILIFYKLFKRFLSINEELKQQFQNNSLNKLTLQNKLVLSAMKTSKKYVIKEKVDKGLKY